MTPFFTKKTKYRKIQTANSTFEIEYLLAWTLVAIVFGFVLEGVVAIFKKVWEVSR